MNWNIAEIQNSTSMLEHLAARNSCYRMPNTFVFYGFMISVGLSLASLAQVWFPEILSKYSAYIAAVSVLYSIFDSWFFEPLIESKSSECASIIDAFDRKVFDIETSEHFRGRVSMASIRQMAQTESPKKIDRLKNWYPIELESVPRNVAGLIAQYTATAYDKALRTNYLRILTVLQYSLFFAIVALGLIGNLSTQAFVLSVMVPFLPILIWVLRTKSKTIALVEDQERALKIMDVQWQAVCSKRLEGSYLKDVVIDNQADLFRRRSVSTLLFPQLYRVLRPKLENHAKRDAKAFVEEYIAAHI